MLDDRSCYSVADPEPDPKLLVGSGSEINVSDPDSVGTIKGTVRYQYYGTMGFYIPC